MKLLLKPRELSLIGAVNLAKMVLPKKTVLPILENVLLEATEAGLTVSATNLDQAIRIKVAAKIEEPGTVAVSPKALIAFLQLCGKETIELSVNKNIVKVNCGDMESEVNGYDAKDYPPIPAPVDDKALAFTAGNLCEALADVEYSAATDSSRPVLECVSLRQVSPRRGEAATADGFRLSIHTFALSGKVEMPELMINREMSALVRKIMPDVKGFKVSMRQEKPLKEGDPDRMVPDRIDFSHGPIWLTSMVPTGKFPDYRQLIPEKCKQSVQVTRESLKKAIAAVIKLNPGSGICRFVSDDGQLRVYASDEGIGKVSFKMAATGDYKGAYNMLYVRDLVDHAGEMIKLESDDTKTPAKVITDNATYVIMPMFVQW